MHLAHKTVINPRCACAARATVVGSVCVSVNQHLTSRASFRPKIISCTQQAMKVEKFLWISLKQLRCRDTLLPAKAHAVMNEACQLAVHALNLTSVMRAEGLQIMFQQVTRDHVLAYLVCDYHALYV